MIRGLLCTFIIVLAAFVSGCGRWAVKSGTIKVKDYSLTVPDGWMRDYFSNDLLLSRNGVLLQRFQVKRINVKDELENTKKTFRKGMLPHEQAQLIIDSISKSEKVRNFVVIANKPVAINGLTGFRIEYKYRDDGDLPYHCLYYGFMKDEWFYGISFEAPERYYFEKYAPEFEESVRTFTVYR